MINKAHSKDALRARSATSLLNLGQKMNEMALHSCVSLLILLTTLEIWTHYLVGKQLQEHPTPQTMEDPGETKHSYTLLIPSQTTLASSSFDLTLIWASVDFDTNWRMHPRPLFKGWDFRRHLNATLESFEGKAPLKMTHKALQLHGLNI